MPVRPLQHRAALEVGLFPIPGAGAPAVAPAAIKVGLFPTSVAVELVALPVRLRRSAASHIPTHLLVGN